MTYEISKKMLESGARKVTKALLVLLSMHFLVILVFSSFPSCSSDIMVEIMAVDPSPKFYTRSD